MASGCHLRKRESRSAGGVSGVGAAIFGFAGPLLQPLSLAS